MCVPGTHDNIFIGRNRRKEGIKTNGWEWRKQQTAFQGSRMLNESKYCCEGDECQDDEHRPSIIFFCQLKFIILAVWKALFNQKWERKGRREKGRKRGRREGGRKEGRGRERQRIWMNGFVLQVQWVESNCSFSHTTREQEQFMQIV